MSRRFLGLSRGFWIAYPAMVFLLTWLLVWLWWPSGGTTLSLRSDPPGAVVSWDGALAGTTPLDLAGLEPGRSYVVRLEHAGYAPVERTFVAQADPTVWTVTLDSVSDPLRDAGMIAELVGQIGASGQETLFSHELADALFTVNPLIEHNPWLTERAWAEIFREIVDTTFQGDSEEFLHHLREYKAELEAGGTSKQAWYQHVHECEEVCRPIVTEVFRRHIAWLRQSGFTMIYFPLDEHRLDAGDTSAIHDFLSDHDLAGDRSRQILLVGRASRIGGQRHNVELSRKRVESVAEELAAVLPDGRARLRHVHLGFEPPQLTPAVVEFLGLDRALNEAEQNQSVMVILSEPIARASGPAADVAGGTTEIESVRAAR